MSAWTINFESRCLNELVCKCEHHSPFTMLSYLVFKPPECGRNLWHGIYLVINSNFLEQIYNFPGKPTCKRDS